jgi:hypothetical protein
LRAWRALAIGLAAIAVVWTWLGGSATAVHAQVPTQPTLRFRPVAFSDPMAGGTTAVSVLVPEGWEASGGIDWLPGWSRVAQIRTYVTDPVSGLSIAWLPIQDFMHFRPPAGLEVPTGGNYQGKAFVPPIRDPATFVREFWIPTVLGHLRDADLVSIRDEPLVADDFLRQFGGAGEAGAWVLRYAYPRDGQPWEQDVGFALLWSSANGITSWYVHLAYAVSGPAGSLDAQQGTISTILASRATTPEWEAIYRLVQRLFYQGIQQQMADTVRFGELLAQHRAESQRLQAEVTAERWASQDRIAQQRRDILGGVENYRDPLSGRIVQLPAGWNTYWVNPQGEYLAVGDGALDASTLTAEGWQLVTPE